MQLWETGGFLSGSSQATVGDCGQQKAARNSRKKQAAKIAGR
jgi:hypothetical protein